MPSKRFIPLLLVFLSFIGCNNSGKKETALNYLRNQTNESNNRNNVPEHTVRVLTEQSFNSVISKGICLVDFWATWCGPCRSQGPIIEEVAKDMGGKVNVYKVDVDNNKDLAIRFNVSNIPTMIIFKNGTPIETFVGLKDKTSLVQALQDALK